MTKRLWLLLLALVVLVACKDSKPQNVGAALPNAGGDASGVLWNMQVIGLQSHALPSLPVSLQLLGYSGSAWTYTTAASIFTPGGDLTGNATAQYVQSIGGANNAGGTVNLGATVNLTALAGAGGVTLGAWTGATTLPTGNLSWAGAASKTLSLVGASTFTLTGGASSTWSLTSGTLGVDAPTLQIGPSLATSLAEGSTNVTTFSQTVKSTGTLTNVVGSTTVASQGLAAGDFWAGGGANPSLSGLIRAANNIVTVAARNAANGADITVAKTDASNNVVFGDPVNATGGKLFGNTSVLVSSANWNATLTDSTGLWNFATNGEEFGAHASVAASGVLRFLNAATIIEVRNSGGSGDLNFLSSSGNNEAIGGPQAGGTVSNLYADVASGGTWVVYNGSTQVEYLGVSTNDFAAYGTAPAQSGNGIRATNGTVFAVMRNSTGTGDLTVLQSNSNNLLVGGSGTGSPSNVYLTSATGGTIGGFINLTQSFSATSTAFNPGSDNGITLGTASVRWKILNAAASGVAIYASSGAANPTTQLSTQDLQMGPGGASSYDGELQRVGAHNWQFDDDNSGSFQLNIGGGLATSTSIQVPTQSGGQTPPNLVLQPMFQAGSDQGSAALNTPGSLAVNLGVPYTTTHAGSEARLLVQRNSTGMLSLGGYNGSAPTAATLTLGSTAVTNSSYTVYADATQVIIGTQNAAGFIAFALSSVSYWAYLYSDHFYPAAWASMGLGATPGGTIGQPWSTAVFGAGSTANTGFFEFSGNYGATPDVQIGQIQHLRVFQKTTDVSNHTWGYDLSGGNTFAAAMHTITVRWTARDTTTAGKGGGGTLTSTFSLPSGGSGGTAAQIPQGISGGPTYVLAFNTTCTGVSGCAADIADISFTVSGSSVNVNYQALKSGDTFDWFWELIDEID